MDVTVGSTNPVKRAAVERALEGRGSTVRSVAVESGVSEQPRSSEETLRGAETRARRARVRGESTLGVGLEGGVTDVTDRPGTWLVMWAAVTDGQRTGRGGGPSIRLPEPAVDRLERGETLGAAMATLTGRSDVGRDVGAIGVCTDGLLDRERALATAVAGAMGPVLTTYYGHDS